MTDITFDALEAVILKNNWVADLTLGDPTHWRWYRWKTPESYFTGHTVEYQYALIRLKPYPLGSWPSTGNWNICLLPTHGVDEFKTVRLIGFTVEGLEKWLDKATRQRYDVIDGGVDSIINNFDSFFAITGFT